MSLGCYIISKKKILLNKELIKDKSLHVSPRKKVINDDAIFIYGDEDETQLVEKILSVDGDHRLSVFSLIFTTLEIYYAERVENTLNKLKKYDLNTYNKLKIHYYSDDRNKQTNQNINKSFKDKIYAKWILFLLSLGCFFSGIINLIFYFTKTHTINNRWVKNKIIFKDDYIIYSALSFFIMFVAVFYLRKNNFFDRNNGKDDINTN